MRLFAVITGHICVCRSSIFIVFYAISYHFLSTICFCIDVRYLSCLSNLLSLAAFDAHRSWCSRCIYTSSDRSYSPSFWGLYLSRWDLVVPFISFSPKDLRETYCAWKHFFIMYVVLVPGESGAVARKHPEYVWE